MSTHSRDTTPVKRGKRAEMKIHPIAELFPPMTEIEYAALKADIQKHGVRLPVITLGGKIIDGKNRWRACQELGIKCPTKEWDRAEPWFLAVSLNLRRRHLSQEQIAATWVRAEQKCPECRAWLDRLRAEAKERQAAGRKAGGKARHGQLGAHMTPKLKSAAVEAEALRISPSTLKRARQVARDAPEELDAIMQGEKSAIQVLQEKKAVEAAGLPMTREPIASEKLTGPGDTATPAAAPATTTPATSTVESPSARSVAEAIIRSVEEIDTECRRPEGRRVRSKHFLAAVSRERYREVAGKFNGVGTALIKIASAFFDVLEPQKHGNPSGEPAMEIGLGLTSEAPQLPEGR